MRYALQVEYDGSRFHGWQSQPHGLTVQDALQQAVGAIAGEPVALVAAGRTDTGVHALAQIVHFDTRASRPLQAWVRGVNAHLPPAVAVRWAHQVEPEFHARFSAVSRSYRYVLFNHPVRPAIQHGRVGWYHRPLDAAAMHEAAACLLGERDFSAFRSSEFQARSPVKTLHEARVFRNGNHVIFEFRAGGFLHHMVRNIVGTLIYAGKGAYDAARVGAILESRSRGNAAPTFAAGGLYLAAVEYAQHWNLPVGRPLDPATLRQA